MPIDLNSSSASAASDLSLPSDTSVTQKEVKNDSYDGSKTKKCLQSKTPDLLMDGLKAATSYKKKDILGILSAVFRAGKDVYECVQDGFKAKDR